MNESDKTTNAAPSAVEEVANKLVRDPRTGEMFLRGIEALDLAKRLDEAQSIAEDAVKLMCQWQDRAERAEAALKRKDGLLRRWLDHAWEWADVLVEDTRRELDGKGE